MSPKGTRPIANSIGPPRLTAKLISRVATVIRQTGAIPLRTLIAFGVNKRTAGEWLSIGRGGHKDYPNPHHSYIDLVQACEQAINQWELDTLKRISSGDPKLVHWKERMAVLKARFSEYGDAPPITVGVNPYEHLFDYLRKLGPVVEEPKALESEGEFRVLPEHTESPAAESADHG